MSDHSIINIDFSTLERVPWIKIISDNVTILNKNGEGTIVRLNFDSLNSADKIESTHLVTLACFIEFLVKLHYRVEIANIRGPVGSFLFDTLQFKKYWSGGENYVPAKDSSIFNLWRVVDNEKDTHSQLVHDYLKRSFFKKKDLSAVKNSLLEVYYNIFDHAQADGNAFSLIRFDKEKEKLYVAVCDFGKGIAKTVRDVFPSITNDSQAIAKAMEDKFTVKSQIHNKGMGLSNVLATCTEDDVLKIISNNGFMYAKKECIKTRENNLNLSGTLIYYEVSLSHFEDEEIISTFGLDF